ncbi:head-tail adaptor protein [Chelativorans sp. ZYF759]|uniref:phage head completion protein n=1 Tax=Chelativorans sp. ZYF759 TaxID=2692213 RepID=UPI00145DEFAC|nr:head-tail adaptor protein [Chelativorans sp. ZYF759]NMG39890.1 head-tail adaptor protein [Chelativorans sp. ZYF759]
MGAGELRHRLAFDRREAVDDGYGNTVGEQWVEQFDRAAGLTYERGNEAVMAARLEGRSIIRVKLRKDSQTCAITTDWRARDVRSGEWTNDDPSVWTGTVYAISDVDAVTDRKWVWLRIEEGQPA